jgi:hypothetical protein
MGERLPFIGIEGDALVAEELLQDEKTQGYFIWPRERA